MRADDGFGTRVAHVAPDTQRASREAGIVGKVADRTLGGDLGALDTDVVYRTDGAGSLVVVRLR